MGFPSTQRSPPARISKTHLPKSERRYAIELRERHSLFRRPYPHAHGDYSNGYEEHEREPATDGFPVR